jgi:hypothetical protein
MKRSAVDYYNWQGRLTAGFGAADVALPTSIQMQGGNDARSLHVAAHRGHADTGR